MTILGIDTSGKTASVAIVRDEEILAENTIVTRLTHSQVILPLCKQLLKDAEINLSDLDSIAIANGPGSYTGLRIGISAVKAMCYGLKIKCSGVSTLQALAYNFLGIKGIVCSVMSARQDLVYSAVFKSDGTRISRITEDAVVPLSTLENQLKDYDFVYVNGDYANTFCNNSTLTNISLAPARLRLQSASSICLSALNNEMYEPEKLNASYLQQTQAEKIKYGIN